VGEEAPRRSGHHGRRHGAREDSRSRGARDPSRHESTRTQVTSGWSDSRAGFVSRSSKGGPRESHSGSARSTGPQVVANRWLSLVVLALMILTVTASCRCGAKAVRTSALPRSVALVNGEPIAAEQFQRELQHSLAEGGEEVTMDLVRKRVLEEMIDRTLLLQQAKARSIAVGQDQVERAFLRLRSEYPSAHFDDLLARERLSSAGLKGRLNDQRTVEKLFAEEVFPQIAVSDDEVRRYYAEHPAEFEQPEQVHAVQILLQTEEEAKRIRDELRRNPQSFEAVAKRSSIAPEGKNGGDLGYFGKGSGMPEVFDVCFRLGKNVLSDVTPSPYGFHIFKVIDRKPAGRRTAEEAIPGIREKLLRERRARAQQDYLSALKKSAQIDIDWAAAAAVTP
jgi:parvulin-like peptidyl-prolyl isomerase